MSFITSKLSSYMSPIVHAADSQIDCTALVPSFFFPLFFLFFFFFLKKKTIDHTRPLATSIERV